MSVVFSYENVALLGITLVTLLKIQNGLDALTHCLDTLKNEN